MLGTLLGAGTRAVNERDKNPWPHFAYILVCVENPENEDTPIVCQR